MSSELHKETQYARVFKRLMAWAGIALVSLAILFSRSQTAHADLLSLLSSIMGGQQASAETTSGPQLPSVEDPILAVNSLTDPKPSCDASSTVPIEDGNAVSSQIASASSCNIDHLNTSVSTYIVQSDDTLSDIALMFGVSVDTLKQANPGVPGISKNVIHQGDSLTILPVDGVLYTVRSGDSIGSIAKKFNATQDDIVAYNSIIDPSSLVITLGEQLVIPHGTISASKAKSYVSSVSSSYMGSVPSFEPLLDPVWDWPKAPAGYYSCPVPGAVLTQGLHGHNAVDLAISYGTPIRASADGTVIVSKSNGLWNGGYGNFVMLSHGNGSETLYAHMEKTAVSIGEHVSQGQTIGYIGMTGMTTGPHVHFEIRGEVNPFVDPALCR